MFFCGSVAIAVTWCMPSRFAPFIACLLICLDRLDSQLPGSLTRKTAGQFLRRGGAALHESPNEGERGFRHLTPPAVDGERVAAVGHLDELGDTLVALLQVKRCVRDRMRNGLVLFPGDDQ